MDEWTFITMTFMLFQIDKAFYNKHKSTSIVTLNLLSCNFFPMLASAIWRKSSYGPQLSVYFTFLILQLVLFPVSLLYLCFSCHCYHFHWLMHQLMGHTIILFSQHQLFIELYVPPIIGCAGQTYLWTAWSSHICHTGAQLFQWTSPSKQDQ